LDIASSRNKQFIALKGRGFSRDEKIHRKRSGLKSVHENGLPELEKNPFGSKAAS
jgi:hypothetical protein